MDGVPGVSTTSAYFVNSSSVYEYRYDLTFDASDLTIGKNYYLCVDKDGFTGSQEFGHSGVTIFVSSVSQLAVEARETDVPTFYQEANQTLLVTCEGDSVGESSCSAGNTTGYLVEQSAQLESLCATRYSAVTHIIPAIPGNRTPESVASPADNGAQQFEFSFDGEQLVAGSSYAVTK